MKFDKKKKNRYDFVWKKRDIVGPINIVDDNYIDIWCVDVQIRTYNIWLFINYCLNFATNLFIKKKSDIVQLIKIPNHWV